MNLLSRKLNNTLQTYLSSGKSILLLGPRQTGKTTLLSTLQADLSLSLMDVQLRQRYTRNPNLLMDEVKALPRQTKRLPLVIVDEVQKLPSLMDTIQLLIDSQAAQFVITGSSARKLMRGGQINLLPGRIIPLRLDPLTYSEVPADTRTITEYLIDGSLPEIVLTADHNLTETLLDAYVSIYLEEEVKAEALVRNLSHFGRFLELAASESGKIVNHLKLSKKIGVSHTTIMSYYQILEDCLIVERIEPYLNTKTRRKLTKAQKYIFFDLGVRRMAAFEGRRPPQTYMGHLFEQFIGLELIRAIHLHGQRMQLHYWRDSNGPEVDWIIKYQNRLIPIEVKWTDSPNHSDCKYLKLFLTEYETAKMGYIVCQTPRPLQLTDTIRAIPWQALCLDELLK